jgi:hypothetical protein
MKLLAQAVVVLLLVQGCALHDRRDAPWDPPRQGALFEQIPNWDNNSSQRCCGRKSSCSEWESPRC